MAGERLATLAQKTFDMDDQRAFALASGDRNPIHVDALAARRTQAGAPVVHGIHLLLWALDAFAASRPEPPPLRGLRAQFRKMVYPLERARVAASSDGACLTVTVQGTLRCEFTLELGPPAQGGPSWPTGAEPLSPELQAREYSIEQLAGLAGRIPFQMTTDHAATAFPAATRWLGPQMIRGLAATSHLVGMICPGLRSLYSELSLERCNTAAQDAASMAFRVTRIDRRYGWITQEVAGGDFSGTIKAFLRPAPVGQPTLNSLARIVAPHEFSGSCALIVGGSRGLGELTAKLIAAGGGCTLVSWQTGEADALRVAEEINAGGGQCTTLRYDALQPAATQLSALTQPPTHAYYFATPLISRPRGELYATERLEEFLRVYVAGFWELTCALRAQRTDVSLFYPSSVFVADRPPGMTEYAMAKAAGEALCADINAQLTPTHVTVKRLPRLPTDQTAALTPVTMENPLEVMLPVVREVQQRPARTS